MRVKCSGNLILFHLITLIKAQLMLPLCNMYASCYVAQKALFNKYINWSLHRTAFCKLIRLQVASTVDRVTLTSKPTHRTRTCSRTCQQVQTGPVLPARGPHDYALVLTKLRNAFSWQENVNFNWMSQEALQIAYTVCILVTTLIKSVLHNSRHIHFVIHS
jgi:hypothetical protein